MRCDSLSIYAVVLNWNRYRDTWECVESLLGSSCPPDAIVLVDNGSTDASPDRLRRAWDHHKHIRLLENKENQGFARAANQGIRYSLSNGAALVFLLNNDAIVERSCIQLLVSSLSEHPEAGVAGPRIMYDSDRDRIWQSGGHFSLLKSGVVSPHKNRLQSLSASENRYARRVGYLTGCAMLVRRAVFEEVGYFDEDFFLYGEDVDFCLRASRSGYQLINVPRAVAWHKIRGIARDRTSPLVLYHLARSRLLMLRKRFSAPYYLYGLVVHVLAFTPYRMLQIVRGSRSIDAARAWMAGTRDGITGAWRDDVGP